MLIGIPVIINENSIKTDLKDGTEEFKRDINKSSYPSGSTLQLNNYIYENSSDTVYVNNYDETVEYADGDFIFGDPLNYGKEKLYKHRIVNNKVKEPQETNFSTSTAYTSWETNKNRYVRIFDKEPPVYAVWSFKPSPTSLYEYYVKNNNDGTFDVSYAYTANNQVVIIQRKTIPSFTALTGNENEVIGSLEKASDASVIDGSNNIFFMPNCVITNPTGTYFRTHINDNESVSEIAVEGDSSVYMEIQSPLEIGGYALIGRTNIMKPFDTKNYTYATGNVKNAYYEFTSYYDFNSIVISGLLCNSIEVSVDYTDENGLLKKQVFSKQIDNKRDKNGILSPYPVTEIFYAQDDVVFKSGYKVVIKLFAPDTSVINIGGIMCTQAVDAGFTNLQIKNSYKDFSAFEYDTFGNADYVERAKVSTYNASVDIKIENYDMIDRLMKSLGKRVVVIDGSDNLYNGTENVYNNESVFSSTQKIGRILNYSQNTVVKENDINKIAKYSLTIEEIV